jgi:diketogulonate reductase-like aldo/keto reductase
MQMAATMGILSSVIPSVPPIQDASRMMLTAPQQTILSVPKVGYSPYKIDPSQVEQCVSLALEAGVQHFDVTADYGSNKQVGNVLKPYFQTNGN